MYSCSRVLAFFVHWCSIVVKLLALDRYKRSGVIVSKGYRKGNEGTLTRSLTLTLSLNKNN